MYSINTYIILPVQVLIILKIVFLALIAKKTIMNATVCLPCYRDFKMIFKLRSKLRHQEAPFLPEALERLLHQ
jgi:hypothetical protein